VSTLDTLEKLTHAWPQAVREEIGRAFGIPYTALRYQKTGSMEGLEFLYPFLNDSDKNIRRYALRAVGKIFHGTGAGSLEKLAYVTENRDLAIRDRSAVVVGLTLAGEPADVSVKVLKPSYTHRNNFIRGHGTAALGLAGAGSGSEKLLPVFEERMSDENDFVRTCALNGLAEAFAGTGHKGALDLLEPLAPFPSFEIGKDEPHRQWHFRWRRQASMHSEAASAIARIGVGSAAETRALELLRQYLRPENVPPKMGFEEQLTQRQGVGAMSWLLRGKPDQAVREMAFLLEPRTSEEPVWSRRLPQSAAIFTLPGTFAGSGDKGVEIAEQLMETEDPARLRCAILSLGVAAQGNSDEKVLSALTPHLSHRSGGVRDVANLAVALAFKGSGRKEAFEALRAANLDDRRGPSTNYPLGVGLLFQGTGDEAAGSGLARLFGLKRRRLRGYAALGVGLIYQGTSDPEAVRLLLPELSLQPYASHAVLPVDFNQDELAALTRCHSLADGPGAAQMFVHKHFVDAPPERYDPWATWL